MEKLFKCSYTGKIFKYELECLKHEFEKGYKREDFWKLVEEFLGYLKYNKIDVVSAEYDTYLKKNFDDIFEYKFMKLKIKTEKGKTINYNKFSDPVGDGRCESSLESLERMIRDFNNEFILPNEKVFEGTLTMFNDTDYYVNGKLNDKDMDAILWVLDGKKIRIEVIDEVDDKS
jgi:hypothetical protein